MPTSRPVSLVFRSVVVVGLSLAGIKAHGADDIGIGDFSGPTYGSWEVTGTAFGTGPTRGDALDKLGISNAHGAGVATSKARDRNPLKNKADSWGHFGTGKPV